MVLVLAAYLYAAIFAVVGLLFTAAAYYIITRFNIEVISKYRSFLMAMVVFLSPSIVLFSILTVTLILGLIGMLFSTHSLGLPLGVLDTVVIAARVITGIVFFILTIKCAEIYSKKLFKVA